MKSNEWGVTDMNQWQLLRIQQLVIHILKTDKVYEKSKLRLHLHDIGFQGFLCLMQGQTFTLEIIHLLTDIILSRGDVSLKLYRLRLPNWSYSFSFLDWI